MRIVLVFFAVVIAFSGESARIGRVQLEDQFQKQHLIEFPTAKPLFIAISDRHGAESLNEWVRAATNQFGSAVFYIGIADVREVPPFLKGFVRKKFAKAYSYPVLLDWTGKAVLPLRPSGGEPNIYIVAPDGSISGREKGDFGRDKISRLEKLLKASLSTGGVD